MVYKESHPTESHTEFDDVLPLRFFCGVRRTCWIGPPSNWIVYKKATSQFENRFYKTSQLFWLHAFG